MSSSRTSDVPERLQIVVNAHPEYSKAVKRHTYTEVVHYANIEVARIRAKVSLVIFADQLEDDGNDGQYGLDLDIFCDITFNTAAGYKREITHG